MRRFRLFRLLSSFVFTVCCLLLVINGFLKVNFRFGIETSYFKYPSTQVETRIDLPRYYPERPWFMRGGVIRPSEIRIGGPPGRLWPHESGGDRIVNQLMYVPPGYASHRNITPTPLKKIVLYFGRRGWSELPMGRTAFIRDRCPVDTCEISADQKKAASADLVLFKDRYAAVSYKRSPQQIWLLFLLECPLHTQSFADIGGLFNWTASYRHDSDIVAPYEKFVPFPGHKKGELRRNYAAGKTKKVAWFVSNCAARNKRLQYARQLAQHIQVDMFGKCSKQRCPKMNNFCFQMLNREYKFYLAFENSNCKDYITEKFFINGLGHDIVPIVMGARPEDYAKVAPPHSYIHVEEFAGPKELAQYLHLLDKNDTLYNSYFQWKNTGEFINTRFWCRLCALLHAPVVPKVYTDIQTWWAGKGTCTTDEWRSPQSKSVGGSSTVTLNGIP
ncbi:glycoprotein 3-alpha-L-fucosyltransferase A-like [Uloborus diversus]|uniref:glycoprotein 3-alpha-L-fucosyltransferase A-like n=1 Tax=Uloborus diversus TaxID=327109 RepID=UPI0024091A03|nr:glycoprotein 3-alpha-L-fucosyltransferase A-like [Uloborus diversus]